MANGSNLPTVTKMAHIKSIIGILEKNIDKPIVKINAKRYGYYLMGLKPSDTTTLTQFELINSSSALGYVISLWSKHGDPRWIVKEGMGIYFTLIFIKQNNLDEDA